MARKTTYKSKSQYNQLWEQAIQPVTVSSLQEIKLALQPFLATPGQEVNLGTEMQWQVDDGKTIKMNVHGKSRSSSIRDVLIEGLQIVQKRMETVEKIKEASKNAEDQGLVRINMQIWDVDNLKFNVDGLIERRLGGKRHGYRIRWVVREGIYEFDPFTNKLFAIEETDA